MSHNVVADPRGFDLDVSRYSQSSTASNVTLGGESYPIGSKVGSSGLFIIGDPRISFGEPRDISSTRTSNQTLDQTVTSGNYLISEKYYFEEWNWQVIRFACLGVFMAIMIGLLGAVVGLAIQGQTACHLDLDWWQGSVIYHVNVPEFYNSDRNNIGDIKGIRERIDYLKHLNIKVVCLNHFLPTISPGFEEVTSFRDVDIRLGTREDMKLLASALHEEDMQLLLELRPAWTSDVHEWFKESRKQSLSGGNTFKEFYVWRGSRPNSEQTLWTMDPIRNQYYKQMNNSERPVLNWDNPKVAKQFGGELESWLQIGVDGFYLRDLGEFYMGGGSLQYGAIHSYLDGFQDLLQSYSTSLGARVLMLEGSYLKRVQAEQPSLLGPILNFVNLVDEPLVMTPGNLTYSIQTQITSALEAWQLFPSTWVSFHLGTYKGLVDQQLLPALQTLLFTVPGTPSIHAGQEVGRDPFDNYIGTRLRMMQWTNPGAGEVPKLFEKGSMLHVRDINQLRKIIRLRQEKPTLRADSDGKEGSKHMGLAFLEVDGTVIFLKRHYHKQDTFFYALNVGDVPVVRDWSSASSLGFFLYETTGKEVDLTLHMSAVETKPKQGILFYIPV